MKPSSNNARVSATNLMFGTFKPASTYNICAYEGCDNDPKFIKNGRIKADTTTGYFQINNLSVYYCRNCIPKIVKDLRKELDDTLWAFK